MGIYSSTDLELMREDLRDELFKTLKDLHVSMSDRNRLAKAMSLRVSASHAEGLSPELQEVVSSIVKAHVADKQHEAEKKLREAEEQMRMATEKANAAEEKLRMATEKANAAYKSQQAADSAQARAEAARRQAQAVTGDEPLPQRVKVQVEEVSATEDENTARAFIQQAYAARPAVCRRHLLASYLTRRGIQGRAEAREWLRNLQEKEFTWDEWAHWLEWLDLQDTPWSKLPWKKWKPDLDEYFSLRNLADIGRAPPVPMGGKDTPLSKVPWKKWKPDPDEYFSLRNMADIGRAPPVPMGGKDTPLSKVPWKKWKPDPDEYFSLRNMADIGRAPPVPMGGKELVA